MTLADLIKHFGTQTKAAKALGLKQPSVANWRDGIPEIRQLQIERLTKGALRAGPECDVFRVPTKKAKAAEAAA